MGSSNSRYTVATRTLTVGPVANLTSVPTPQLRQHAHNMRKLVMRKCGLIDAFMMDPAWVEVAPLLTALEDVDVSCNNLTVLPSWLRTLPALQALTADHNFIAELPTEDWHHLQLLNVSHNELRLIPSALRGTPSLISAVISANYLDYRTVPPECLELLHGAMCQYVPTEITPTVYLGSAQSAQKAQLMQSLGITHVVVAAIEETPQHPDTFQYHCLDLSDTPEQAVLGVLGGAVDFMRQGIAAGGRVLVHCRYGVSRSTTVVLAHLIATDTSLTVDAALRTVQALRPCVKPNRGFHAQLEEYRTSLQGVQQQE